MDNSGFKPGDECLVVWADGSIYAGFLQKLYDPVEDVVYSRRRDRSVQGHPANTDSQWRADKTIDSAEGIEVGPDMQWFRVHYRGWKSQYDDWVPERRLLAATPENLALMARVNASRRDQIKQEREKEREKDRESRGSKHRTGDKPEKKPKRTRRKGHENTGSTDPATTTDGTPEATTPAPPPRKRARKDPSAVPEIPIGDTAGGEIRVGVPLEVKRILVDDWELVTKSKLIITLPRPIPVVDILDRFREWSAPRLVTDGLRENMAEFVTGMCAYFDRSLGMLLLYRFERQQYFEFYRKFQRQQGSDHSFRPCRVYGAEHLARLLVSMPALLAQAQLDDKTLEYLVNEIGELGRFLSVQRDQLFGGAPAYDVGTRLYEEAAEMA